MLAEHLAYVSDPVRLERFKSALRSVVKQGDRVADLGCGTGILGLMALRAGAAHLYAIEESGMIEVARETLARCGMEDRVSFIRGRSQQVELPERVDIAICDHVDSFGFDYGIVRFLQDARRRFLKPGGALIPASVGLQIAAVESERCRALAERWGAEDIPVEFHWLRAFSVNSKHSVDLERDELLGAPATLGGIDFYAINPDFFSWTAELRVDRDGVVHGWAGWFNCELAANVWMTNSPVAEEPIRRSQSFLPIGEGVSVKAGDRIEVTVRVRPGDGLIAWDSAFPASGRRFSHSTWQAMLLSPRDLSLSNPNRVPRPSHAALARGIVLGYCDGTRTAREIEQAVLREHPALFPSAMETCRFIVRVLGRETE